MIPLLILSPLVLLAAFGAVWKARPVHAALLLALTLALTAVLYLLMGADFIGLAQFLVYVGAVAVLIVFSLLITRHGDEAEEKVRRPHVMVSGVLCSLAVLAALVGVAVKAVMDSPINEGGTPSLLDLQKLGTLLFTTHAPAVLAVAVLLTAVTVGAALFAREPKKSETSPE